MPLGGEIRVAATPFPLDRCQGVDCVSCHAPTTTYMVVDPRHDHSFRIPRPDLTVKWASPTLAIVAMKIDRHSGRRADHMVRPTGAGSPTVRRGAYMPGIPGLLARESYCWRWSKIRSSRILRVPAGDVTERTPRSHRVRGTSPAAGQIPIRCCGARRRGRWRHCRRVKVQHLAPLLTTRETGADRRGAEFSQRARKRSPKTRARRSSGRGGIYRR